MAIQPHKASHREPSYFSGPEHVLLKSTKITIIYSLPKIGGAYALLEGILDKI